MSVDPVVADGIRKAAAVLLAAAGTFVLLRVLHRTAIGTQRLWDWELWAFVACALLAVAWIRAAKRVRPPRPPDAGPRG